MTLMQDLGRTISFRLVGFAQKINRSTYLQCDQKKIAKCL